VSTETVRICRVVRAIVPTVDGGVEVGGGSSGRATATYDVRRQEVAGVEIRARRKGR
jgi:hypothetical protein